MPVIESKDELKELVKEAAKEAFIESSETFKEMLSEVLEDIALLQRIEEGLNTEIVSREEIMEILQQDP